MTREEQTASAYKDYLNNGGMLQSNPWFAFKAGAKWADQHPKNVWHSPEEEPQGEYEIMIHNKFGITKLIYFMDFDLYYDYTWADYVIDEGIVSWAYINDLLPKGGNV